MTIGPDASAIARLTVATSSPRDVRGGCTAVTEWPLAARSGITFAQLDPSAQAPCTRITSDDFAISFSPSVFDCLASVLLGRGAYWLSTRAHMSVMPLIRPSEVRRRSPIRLPPDV